MTKKKAKAKAPAKKKAAAAKTAPAPAPAPKAKRRSSASGAREVTLESSELHRALSAVSLAASKDAELPHLNAVLFEASDELVLTATDGTWVARWTCEPTECSPAPVKMLARLADVKRLLPLLAFDARRGANRATISFEAGNVILDDRTVLSLVKVGAEFPAIDKVWPSSPLTGVPYVGFYTSILMRAARAFKAANGVDAPIRLQFREVEGPISVYSDSVPELAVLLMPARIEAPMLSSPEGKRQLGMFDSTGALAKEVKEALSVILDPDGTGQTKVSIKRTDETEFRQVAGPTP